MFTFLHGRGRLVTETLLFQFSKQIKRGCLTLMDTHSETHKCGHVIPFRSGLAVRVHWDHLGLVEKIQTPGLLSLE